ncbi:hypothetical protein ACIBQ1_37920 [Nonomuraea sp. NPDC050153]|uniref:hypothetical protein n=1 Tax=Nonomuraea sp. NPDC050153 TaxID=3364359 RepID=UPI00378B6B01
MRQSSKAALASVALTCCVLASALPVRAAVPAGNAPACVTVWQATGRITKTGYARNDCGRTLRLNIVWARGTDGECYTVRAGETISSKVARGVRTFDGADAC